MLPPPASAHLAATGLGPFYDSLWHFLLTPEQIFPALAFALYAGLRGPAQARTALFALPAAWLAASFLPRIITAHAAPLLSAAAVLAAGALLAINARLPRIAVLGAAIALGGALASTYEVPDGPAGAGIAALAPAASLFVLAALAASLSLPLRATAAIVAVRVAGSWTAALGLLLCGWWFRTLAHA